MALLAVGALAFAVGAVSPAWTVLGIGWDVLVVALLVVDGLRARRVPLSVERTLPPRLHQHDDATLELRLHTPHPSPLAVVVRDPLHPHLSPTRIQHRGERIQAPGAVWTDTLHPRHRGVAALGPIVVRIRGPLGLAWHQRTLDTAPPEEVRVLAQRHLDGDDGRFVHRALSHQPGRLLQRAAGASHALAHLREYHPGDARRAIHWRASARRHRPITRVTRQSHHRHVVLLVDAGRTMQAATDHRSRFDRMLAAVLAYARVLVQSSDSASIVVYDATVRSVVHLDPRTRTFRAAYDALCDLEPSGHDSDPGVATAWVRAHSRRGMHVVFCTALTDPTGAARLKAASATCARRHPTLLLHLSDADLEAAARMQPDTVLDAYVKASAMAHRDRLHTIVRELEAAGVRVAQAPSDRLVVSLALRLDGRRAAR